MAIDRDTRAIIRRNLRDPFKRQRYVDALLRHQIYALRIGGSTADDAIRRIASVDAQVAKRIRDLVSRPRPTVTEIRRLSLRLSRFIDVRLEPILRALRTEWLDWAEYSLERHGAELAALAISVRPAAREIEARIVRDALSHRMGVESALSVDEMISRAATAHSQQVANVVRRSWEEGESIADALRSFRALRIRRNDWLQTAARTALLAVSNQAREQQLLANRRLLPRVMWVSTLDHRTSSICQSLDGNTYRQGQGPRPPAHPNCRSVVIPLLPGESAADAIGVRPSTQAGPTFRYKRRESQAALQRRLRLDRGVKKGRRGDPTFARKPIEGATYQEFLRRQPAAFQDFVLGRTRGKLFRSGKISFDRFFDQRGRYVPVRELLEKIRRLER